jgi:hypothetical protein
LLTAILALLSVAGAWVAWRRNPSYSSGSTLRMLLVTALSITALVLFIALAANFAVHSSTAVAMTTMFAAVVVGALAMIFIIQRVSTPKAAALTTALPPSAKLLHVHRQKVYRGAKFFAILLAACGLLAAVIPGSLAVIPLTLGGLALLLAVILVPVMYVNARARDRALTALELDPWLHWQYPQAQWQQWIEVQSARAQAVPPTFVPKRDWRKLAWPFGIIAVGVFGFAPGSLLFKGLYVGGCCGAIAGLVMLSRRSERHAAANLRTKLRDVAPEVYFGHDGLYCDGVFTTWLGLDIYLQTASIDQRAPRSALFRFEKVVVNPYGGNQFVPVLQGVLIPDGAEGDLARLQRLLAERCPKAQIALA